MNDKWQNPSDLTPNPRNRPKHKEDNMNAHFIVDSSGSIRDMRFLLNDRIHKRLKRKAQRQRTYRDCICFGAMACALSLIA